MREARDWVGWARLICGPAHPRRLAPRRIARLQLEAQAQEVQKAEAQAQRAQEEQAWVQLKEQEVLKLQEEAKNITQENLEARIEKALDSPKSYNWAVTKEGQVVRN